MTERNRPTDCGAFAYRHSGVVIASDLELPEWNSFAVPADRLDADIRIELGEVAIAHDPASVHGEYAASSLKFAVRGAGRWNVSAGRTIRIDIDGDTDEARLFTLGSAWGALGYQRGWPMLHGSAVALGGKAIMFAGDQDMGKSTMAAAMLACGARLIADDLSRCELGEGGAVSVHPTASRIKLWSGAIEHFGWQDRVRQRDHFRDEKFHLDCHRTVDSAASVPLGAVCVLGWGDGVEVERLQGGEAVSALSEATIYRKEYLELMGRLSDHVAASARIAAATPVYRLTRPRDFDRLDEVCETVKQICDGL